LPRLEILHLVGVVPPHKVLSELESSKEGLHNALRSAA